MIHHFFERVLRLAGLKPIHAAGLARTQQCGDRRIPAARVSSAFLAQILETAMAQKHHHAEETPVMRSPPEGSRPEHIRQEAEPMGGNVIPLFPRQRAAPGTTHGPPKPDDDNPGPRAA